MALPALLLAAATAIGAPVEPAPTVSTWAVDAGTEGVLVEDHRAPVVAVRVEFPVGTWSPWTRAHHSAEAFTAQDDDPARALRKRADALGVELYLGMGDRGARIYGQCLKRDLDALLKLLRDVLANTRYDERDLKRRDRARSIQWKANDTDVNFRLGQAAARALFKDVQDPRRREWEKPERIETKSAALAAARDELIRFPGRRIGFAGDMSADEARRAAEGLLPPPAGEAPADLAPVLGPLVPAAERPKDAEIRMRKLSQVYFAYGRDSLPWIDPRRPAFLVANHVLGGHFYSRLYTALRHEGGDTYGVGTRETGDVAPGTYGASTFTRAANAARIEAKLRETMRVFHEKGITEEERLAAIGNLTGRRAFARQSPEQILGRYMDERRFDLAPGYFDALVDRASKLTLDEVNAFIRDFYDPAQFSMIRAVPK